MNMHTNITSNSAAHSLEASMALFSSLPLNASHVSTMQGWRARASDLGARSAIGAARAYARANGFGVMMMADDTAREFALDHESGKIREWARKDNFKWVA
jgi:hypothetical protein